MKKDEKIKKLKEILPLAWNSYQHMYDTRRTSTKNSASFLLVAISFLSIISLSFFDYFKNEIFLFSLFIQVIAFSILLKMFFIEKPLWVHWFKIDSTLKNLEKSKFEEDLFASLKSIEGWTWVYINEMNKIITFSIYATILSLYTSLLGLIFIYFGYLVEYILTLILTILIITLLAYYKKNTNYNLNLKFKNYSKIIEEWLNKK